MTRDAVRTDFGFQFQIDASTAVAEAQPIGFATGDERAAWVEAATGGDA